MVLVYYKVRMRLSLINFLIVLFCLSAPLGAEALRTPEQVLQETSELITTAGEHLYPPSVEGLSKAEAAYRKALWNVDEIERRFETERANPESKGAFETLAQFRTNCAVGLAMIHGMRQDEGEAIKVVTEQLPLVERSGDKLSLGQLHKTLADSYYRLQDLRASKSHFQKALEYYHTGPERYAEAIRYARLSYYRCLEDLGEADLALEELGAALAASRKLDDSKVRENAMKSSLFERAYFYLRQGDRAKAERDIRAMLDLSVVKDDPLEKFPTLLALYNACHGSEREAERSEILKQAGLELEKAQASGRSVPGSFEQTYHLALLNENSDTGDVEGVLRHIERIDELHAESGIGGLSPAFQSRYNVYQTQGRGGELLPLLQTYLDGLANPTFEDLRLHLTLIGGLAGEGNVEQALTRLAALQEQLRSLEANSLLLEAKVLEGKLYDQYELGDKATELYEESLQLARRLGRQEMVRDLKVALFQASLRKPNYLQDKAKVRRDFEELLSGADFAKVSTLELSSLVSSYVRELIDQGNYQEAQATLDFLGQSFGGKSPFVDRYLTVMKAKVRRKLGDLDNAESEIVTLTSLAEQTSDIRFRRRIWEELVEWKMAVEENLESDPILAKLAELEDQEEQVDEKILGQLFKARLAGYRGRRQEQMQRIERAEDLLISVRQSGAQLGLQSAYLNLAMEVYQALVIRLVADEKYDEAFSATERALGLTLGALFSRAESDILRSATPEEKRELDALFARRETLEGQMLRQGGTQADKTLEEISTLVGRVDGLLAKIAQRVDGSNKLFSGSVDADYVRRNLRQDQALVRFFTGDLQSYAFLLAPDRPTRVVQLAGADEIMQKVSAYRRAIQLQAGNTAKLGEQLSNDLFGELPELAEFEEIVVVPDGPLYLLPFSALQLPNGKPFFSLSLSILPSARSLSFLEAPRGFVKGGEVTVFANPQFSSGSSSESAFGIGSLRVSPEGAPAELPGTAKEADLVRRLCGQTLKVRSFEGRNASRKSLEEINQSGTLKRSRIVHFATHGFTVPEDPRLSGLILSLVDENGRPNNGYLRLVDIYGLNLDADLVVLSACQTGLGTIRHGDGLLGMYQGFLTAGGRQVLTTLWSVDDEATAQFFEYFYKALMDGRTAKESLAFAQESMLNSNQWSSPFFWAAFQIVSR